MILNSSKILILGVLTIFFIGNLGVNSSEATSLSHGISRYGSLKYPQNFQSFDYVNPEAPKGGALRTAVLGSFETLTQTLQGAAPEGLALTYDTLLVRAADEPFSMYGLVAESVEVAPDNSWVLFNLNSRAKFHDGSAITPEDIIFSWEIQRDKGLPRTRTLYSKVEKAEKIGEHGVKFTFKKDASEKLMDPERPLIMGMMPLYSKKNWEGKEFDAVTLKPFLGSGAYRISKFEPGRFIEYERVKDYWAENHPTRKGLKNFDLIRYDYYRNANVALEAFKAGQYDIIHEADLNRWKNVYKGPGFSDGRIQKMEVEHTRPAGIKGFIFNTRRDIFKDRRVREALMLMFDFEWMNKNLFDGGFKRMESFYENSPFKAQGKPTGDEKNLLLSLKDKIDPQILEEEALTPPQYDGSGNNRDAQTKSLTLLKEAGWILKKGVLTHQKTGKPFVFEILLSDPQYEKLALSFGRSLKKIGIIVKVRMVDSAQYEERRLDWDYDMIFNWWASSLSPGNEQRLYWTQKAGITPGLRNYPNIQEESVDILVDKLATAKTEKELFTTARSLDRVLRYGIYMIPLYYSNVDRLAYWDKFGMPPHRPEIGPNPMAWWTKTVKITK
ncbi:MAG: hypothetical protein B7Y25_00930 [Alphaproteobacteria bacterium 16-39-46]|nr:MAG: hypothetical protein B7Y25_00930 [Alphaproteobacteria bacterium 16-39-46]OZA44277.1 MAG: hypothetical protein B7X84_00870 [Alphaproteobacteria bacterium 17-39-52]HQS83495.1 extracellular solute-binding protein [Alphaproteobacteria bacterium]HQS93206.1 extracellular solute-binding protein [Alphaproteobacteria bacterium]